MPWLPAHLLPRDRPQRPLHGDHRLLGVNYMAAEYIRECRRNLFFKISIYKESSEQQLPHRQPAPRDFLRQRALREVLRPQGVGASGRQVNTANKSHTFFVKKNCNPFLQRRRDRVRGWKPRGRGDGNTNERDFI